MAGRPPLFKTPEELQGIIDEYFEECVPTIIVDGGNEPILNRSGQPMFKSNSPTITGLALALGFVSRQSIYDYEKRNDGFSYTIKKARLRCENYVEKGLLDNDIQAAAGIFILKNYNWTDKQEIEHSGEVLPNKIQIEIIDPKKDE